MVEEKRNKPAFRRTDWHKKIKLGSNRKKSVGWRAVKGRQNKIRLGIRGKSARPRIGWSADKAIRGKINGMEAISVENLKQLSGVKKGQGILISKIGKKKREEIIKKATEMKITILNKYRNSEEKK
jgi:ribosomal protein L32E